MSRADGSILGLEHGKIGDRIAVVLNGKQIYKKLYKPTNPQTPKQQQHRAKIAFVNRLAAVLADAVKLGFALVPKPGSMQSPRNAFVKTNWDNGSILWNEDKGEWTLCPERLLVAYGPRHIDGSITASVDNGKLHISCTNPRLKERNAVDDDQLMVAVYRPAIPTMNLYEGPLRKECGECDFMLPTDASGEDDVMHVYAWFQATLYHRAGGGKDTVRPNQASPSVYLGVFHL